MTDANVMPRHARRAVGHPSEQVEIGSLLEDIENEMFE
jgi:hypothetical protein